MVLSAFFLSTCLFDCLFVVLWHNIFDYLKFPNVINVPNCTERVHQQDHLPAAGEPSLREAGLLERPRSGHRGERVLAAKEKRQREILGTQGP